MHKSKEKTLKKAKNAVPARLMPPLACVALVLALSVSSLSRAPQLRDTQKQDDFGLPELHKVNSAVLEPSYSCRDFEDFHKGYEKTALYLSRFSRDHSPELLFNGACKADDDVEGMLAGDDMSLIADLGEVSLNDTTAQFPFVTRGVHFERIVKVRLNHTYALLINRSTLRGLVIFSVVGHVPNQRLELNYVVKEYQILTARPQSPGFDWGR